MPEAIPHSKSRYLALVVVSGAGQGQRVSLDRPLLLGRDPRSRITFSDERVSRHHALVDFVNGRLVLRDLGSRNGTFVNGREINDDVVLSAGDRVRIGKTQLAVISELNPLEDADTDAARSVDTRADVSSQEFDESEDGHLSIDRRHLRRAAVLSSRVSALCRTRHALAAVISAVRKEFQADAAGLYYLVEPFEACFIEGELGPIGELILQFYHLASETPVGTCIQTWDIESGRLAEKGDLLAFAFKVDSERTGAFLLRRDSSRPFDADCIEYASAVAECFRVLPFKDLLCESSNDVLADHLGIIGSSEAMNRVRQQLRTFAATEGTVLLHGESGTGKELSARAIAQLSRRRFGPYVEVNCACMMPDLIEADLFGHEQGAFTGAIKQRIGKLEIADGGTIFLDEIGEIPLDLQAKLLRVLEGQPFYRVGGSELIRTDVRFICATNRNLEMMVREGLFREDLYHRINVLRVILPPLRTHLEDVPELVPFLISRIQEEYPSDREYSVTPKAYRRLLSHSWPGNVRELYNVLQRMILLSSSPVLDEGAIPADIGSDDETTTVSIPRLQMLTEMIERDEITRVLMETNGHKSKAAKILGISRPTLDKKIKSYNLGSLTAGKSQAGS